jgi:hypothetical protein
MTMSAIAGAGFHVCRKSGRRARPLTPRDTGSGSVIIVANYGDTGHMSGPAKEKSRYLWRQSKEKCLVSVSK